MRIYGMIAGLAALVTALTASSAPVWASRGEDPAATYVWRGLHLDESRHFFGKETVKEILDRMSRTKLNTFHWHLVDDHGWRLQIDRYPNLTKRGAVRRLVKDYAPQPSWRDLSDHGEYGPYFYTKDDVREIVAYAHARGIRVVPEIEIPGHSLAACASYPELSCFPENLKGEDTFLHPSWRTQAVGKRVMCLSKPFTYEFLENVLDEVCELFPDEFIHLGGDEVPIWNWKACTNCQAKIAREGLGDEHGLKHQAMRHFCEYVIKKGKRPVCWEEIVAAGAPTQTVAMVWHEPEGAVKIAEMGYDVIMTPYGTCYLDDPAGELSIDRIRAFDPRAALPSHLRHKVIGAQTCSWTELICTSRELLMQMWPRAGALFSGGFVRTGFRLSTLFGDGAVVQRRKTVPVWGYGAEPGLRMEATLGKAHGFATANRDGDFLFRLPPQEAGGPYELKVRDEKGRELVSRDVYVGEVWICSGQSNMEFKMPGAKPGFGERDFPLVRMFNVGYATGETPMREPQGSWIPGKVGFADAFSAVGGFFARRLQQELGVAVGMLNASVGGTRIEAWMSRRALGACAAGREVLAEAESSFHDPIYWDDSCEYQSDVWPLDEGPGDKVAWAKPGAEDAGWIKAQVPGYFSEQYKSNFNGAVWYRRTVEIPSAWAGHRLALEIPCADKMDIAYFDGVEIGRTGSRYTTWYHDKPRRYEVPASLVKAGAATLAIRVWSQAYAGGIGGEPAKLRLVLADDVGDPLVVGGEWLTRIERNVGVTPNGKLPFVPSTDRSPGSLYQSMVAPLVPYAVAGAIWYQGESNASRRGKSDRYGDLLAEMVRDWRGAFDCGDFAFCATELAGFESPKPFNPLSPWSEIGAECLRASREVPNCGVVSARDLFIPDNPSDIHPTDKQAIGNRFAQWALATQYGRTDLVACGPRFLSAEVRGSSVTLRFTEVGSGLVAGRGAADEPVRGFWIAGADGAFVPANARIAGDTVVLGAPSVASPSEVRYAWAMNPVEANLYNREGLPATAFRWSLPQDAEVLIADVAARAGATNWRTMAYETQDGIRGGMLYAAWGLGKPQAVKIPLPVRGRYRIALGLAGTRMPMSEAPFGALVRLAREPAPVFLDSPAPSNDAGWWFQPVEVEWKTAELDHDTLVVERPSNCRTGFCWVRLTPAGDAEPPRPKRHVVTNDAYHPYASMDEVKAPIMRFADSSVRAVHYCVGNGPFTIAAPSAVAPSDRGDGNAHFENARAAATADTYAWLRREHPHLVDELADFAHSVGLEFHVSFRTGCAIDFVRMNSASNRADSGTGLFAPENFCRQWDGTPVARLSYASEAVQDFFLRFYAEQLTDKVDGICLIWIRALPAMLFEQAFRERFRKACGEELAKPDDPRVVPLRKRVLTDFLRRVRKLAGRKRVSLVVPARGELCESFGLDVPLLAREGLVDEFCLGDSLQTARHDESFDYIDFAYFRRALEGTSATYLPFLWRCDAAAARKGMENGAAGALLWDAGDKSWNDWRTLDAPEGRPPAPPTVHPLGKLDGFDATSYPWHVAY